MAYDIPLYIKHPDSAEFASRSLRNHPAPIIDDYFIEELTLIGGRDRFGEPILRIVWGQAALRVKHGQLGMCYPLQVWQSATGEIYEIGTPRFIIEQKFDPVFCDLDTWQVDLQGPRPIKGLYRAVLCIQTKQGEYARPDRRVLTELKAMDYRRRHDHLAALDSHEERPSAYVTEQKVKRLEEDLIARKQAERKSRTDDIRTIFKEHKQRLFSRHPNEGKALDPYIESKKAKVKYG